MEMHMEVIVDAPAECAWRVLGQEFGQIGEWAVAILASRLDREVGLGAVRTCEIGGFGPVAAGEITEELTRFDAEAMAFTYVGTSGLPAFLKRATNRWSIEPLGEAKCRVRSHATLELAWWIRPLGPLMRWRMRVDSSGFAEELKHRIEEGRAHPRKMAALGAKSAP